MIDVTLAEERADLVLLPEFAVAYADITLFQPDTYAEGQRHTVKITPETHLEGIALAIAHMRHAGLLPPTP